MLLAVKFQLDGFRFFILSSNQDRIFLFVFGGRDANYEDDELAYRNAVPTCHWSAQFEIQTNRTQPPFAQMLIENAMLYHTLTKCIGTNLHVWIYQTNSFHSVFSPRFSRPMKQGSSKSFLLKQGKKNDSYLFLLILWFYAFHPGELHQIRLWFNAFFKQCKEWPFSSFSRHWGYGCNTGMKGLNLRMVTSCNFL